MVEVADKTVRIIALDTQKQRTSHIPVVNVVIGATGPDLANVKKHKQATVAPLAGEYATVMVGSTGVRATGTIKNIFVPTWTGPA